MITICYDSDNHKTSNISITIIKSINTVINTKITNNTEVNMKVIDISDKKTSITSTLKRKDQWYYGILWSLYVYCRL